MLYFYFNIKGTTWSRFKVRINLSILSMFRQVMQEMDLSVGGGEENYNVYSLIFTKNKDESPASIWALGSFYDDYKYVPFNWLGYLHLTLVQLSSSIVASSR